MDSNPTLPDLLHNLDATTYFFVTSGLFVGVVALVFFILGLWFGGLLWRRYKSRCRDAEATIESLKNEAAQLKRRIAGHSPRAQGSASTPGLPEPRHAPMEEGYEQESLNVPPGRPFTLWALPLKDEPDSAPSHASRAFTVWTEPPAPKAVGIAEVLSNTPAEAPAADGVGFTAPLLFPTQPEPAPQIIALPPSQAFSLWTEEGWEPTPTPLTPPYSHPSAAFTLWTHEDFVPVCGAVPPSPPPTALPVLPLSRDALIAAAATAVRSVASHPRQPGRQVIVTFSDERATAPPSRAFTLWTQSQGSPSPSPKAGGSGISQRSALASLIRNRVEAPPLPALPPLDLEPLPFVPAPETDVRGA
jgi:hypothetical protein